MQMPPTDLDTLFAELLQALPAEAVTIVYAFKACTRARKIKTPQQLLQAVLLYCGLAQGLHEAEQSASPSALFEQMVVQSLLEHREPSPEGPPEEVEVAHASKVAVTV